MIDFSQANIDKVTFHKFSVEDARSSVNENEYELDEEHETLILKTFLKPFESVAETYEFKHEIDIDLNVLAVLSNDIVEEERDFLSVTKDVHTHLQAVSKHPNIKDGDLFLIKYSGVAMNGHLHEAFGIYKVENKQSFIETVAHQMTFRKGIGSRKLDKACLIVFTDGDPTVFVIDNASVDTEYWKEEFIKVEYRKDYINSTNQFMSMTKDFITEQFPEEYEATKAEQIDLLNRSVDYFKEHETFEKESFEEQVFQHETLIESFRSYDQEYQQANDLELEQSFEISPQAVKKQARVFKSVLKLDKNFHIYIHGDRELIEQGVEDDGRKFYKIYFDKES